MPEARLQRTREAYPRFLSWTEMMLERVRLPEPQWRIWTDDQGHTHRERLPERFEVRK